MRNRTIVNQILSYVPRIDFRVSQSGDQVNLFETTIRYMGGLLSAYDLLNDPSLQDLADNVRPSWGTIRVLH